MATGPNDRTGVQYFPYRVYAMHNEDTSAMIWEDWSTEPTITETTWTTWTITCQREFEDVGVPGPIPEPTAEETAQREREREIEQARQEEERVRREKERKKEAIQQKKAERKARKLLFDLIGKTNYRKFMHSGYLDVEGKSGRVYRIKPKEFTKVFEGKDKLDVVLESLCITTRSCNLPKADDLIWKKLMIENDEEEFRKIACNV